MVLDLEADKTLRLRETLDPKRRRGGDDYSAIWEVEQTPMLSSPLTTRYAVGSALVLEVHGEVDLPRIDELRDALTEAIELAPPRLVVDLAATNFMDSSALGVLVGSHRKAEHQGVSLVLAGAHGVVARLLAMTGVGAAIGLYLDVDAALASSGA